MGVRVAGHKKPPSLKKVGGNKFQALIRIAILRLPSRRTKMKLQAGAACATPCGACGAPASISLERAKIRL